MRSIKNLLTTPSGWRLKYPGGGRLEACRPWSFLTTDNLRGASMRWLLAFCFLLLLSGCEAPGVSDLLHPADGVFRCVSACSGGGGQGR